MRCIIQTEVKYQYIAKRAQMPREEEQNYAVVRFLYYL